MVVFPRLRNAYPRRWPILHLRTNSRTSCIEATCADSADRRYRSGKQKGSCPMCREGGMRQGAPLVPAWWSHCPRTRQAAGRTNQHNQHPHTQIQVRLTTSSTPGQQAVDTKQGTRAGKKARAPGSTAAHYSPSPRWPTRGTSPFHPPGRRRQEPRRARSDRKQVRA